MPAQAGIHAETQWIPVFAGVTVLRRLQFLHLLDDLPGGIAQVVRRDDGKAAFGEDGFSFLAIGAFEAEDQRAGAAHLPRRLDAPLGDDAAAPDAGERKSGA